MNEIQILLFIAIIACCLVFTTNEIAQTKQIIEQSKIRRNQGSKMYENCLEKVADPFLIFQYFEETKKRLPDNLHNIMLAHCLGDNYFATSYIKALDPEGKADDYFKRKTRVLG
jgi:hypothetical protein